VSWLAGRVALLSGGGSGIGRATLEAFLAEGARAAVLERDPGKCAELERLGDSVRVVEGDATSAADNQRAVAAALERFGRLDAAATFVGVFDNYTPLAEIAAESFEAAFAEAFETNVASVLHAARAAGPALVESRGSLTITCSSSSFYPGRGGTLYVATKHALRGVVVSLAREMAPEVRVNGVAPGGTLETDLRGMGSLGQAEQRLDDRPGREAALRARTPLEVALRSEDHAGAYVYLASDRARGVSGEIVRSDGGLAAR
jgi:NAD(P)-dependent dehydrogenase (short-subunit alcohol dehydrogenase family)